MIYRLAMGPKGAQVVTLQSEQEQHGQPKNMVSHKMRTRSITML